MCHGHGKSKALLSFPFPSANLICRVQFDLLLEITLSCFYGMEGYKCICG